MTDAQLAVLAAIAAAVVLAGGGVLLARQQPVAAVAVVLGVLSAAGLFMALVAIRQNRDTRAQVRIVQRTLTRPPSDAQLRAMIRRAMVIIRRDRARAARRARGRRPSRKATRQPGGTRSVTRRRVQDGRSPTRRQRPQNRPLPRRPTRTPPRQGSGGSAPQAPAQPPQAPNPRVLPSVDVGPVHVDPCAAPLPAPLC